MAEMTRYIYDTLPMLSGVDGFYTTSTAITSEQMMMDYIDRTLGAGLMNVEIHPYAVKDCMNEAIEYFMQYNTLDRAFMLVDLRWFSSSACTDGGLTLPDNVKGVFALESDTRGSGINTLFTLENQLNMAGYFDFRNFDLVSWELVSEWMKLKDLVLGQRLAYWFDHRKRKFYITPRNFTYNGFCVIGVYLNPPAQSLWNNPWIREYSVEAVRLRVGEARSKFGATNLLGGGTIDGKDWITRAETRLKELKEDLVENTMNNDPADFFMG